MPNHDKSERGSKAMSFVEIRDLTKSFGEGLAKVNVLNGVNMTVEKGELCTVLGQSGSGNSTLLNILGGLDTPSGGQVLIDGGDIAAYDAARLSQYRRDYLGFVFQFYNLVPNLTVLENIQVGEYLSASPLDIDEILSVLGLSELKGRFPQELSGGQQQRCSIGRALIKNPRLLLCDEPTGALDYKTSKDILTLIEKINNIYNTTVIIVTHNQTISEMTHKTIRLKDGVVCDVIENQNRVKACDLEW